MFLGALLLAGALVYFSSCSKKNDSKPKTTTTTAADTVATVQKIDTATSYTDLTREEIAQIDTTLTDNGIAGTNSTGSLLNAGDVYAYKTKTGLYGKLKIDGIDASNNYALMIDAVTFKADGTVSKQVTNLIIHGTWSADLDNLVETSDDAATDLEWDRQTNTDTKLYPVNGAKLTKYAFKAE